MAREFQVVFPKTAIEFARLKIALDLAMEELGKLNPVETMDPELDILTANLIQAYQSVESVRQCFVELHDTIERVTAQRRSAAEAFEIGWQARLKDIAARLTNAEYAQLKRALDEITGEDAANTIPF